MSYSFFDDSFVRGVNGYPAYCVYENTKGREIHAPNEPLREVHQRLLCYFEESLAARDHLQSAHARIWDMVKLHLPNRTILRVDISKAYKSVHPMLLARALAELDSEISCPIEEAIVAGFLRKYCFHRDTELLTGGNASPDLFNIYCEVHIDEELRAYAAARGLVYTRYMDDLIFSVPQDNTFDVTSVKRRREIYQIIRAAGFDINIKKVWWINTSKQTIEICGLTVGCGCEHPQLSRRRKRELLSLIETIKRLGEGPKRFALMVILTGKMSPIFCLMNKAKAGEYRLTRSERTLLARFRRVQRL